MNRWKRFNSWALRSRALSHVPADQLPGGAADATPPASSGAPGKIDGPLTLDNIDADDPAVLKAAFKQLQAESRDHRLKARDYRNERDQYAVELKSYKEKEQLEQIKRAEDAKNYEQALALRDQEAAKERQIAQAAAVDSKLEAAFLKKGFEPKFMKLLDKTGISIDTTTGTIRGVDEAIERMEAEFGDVITVRTAAAPAGQQAPAAGQAQEPPNPADKMNIPGTMQTYGQYKDSLNPGRAPAGGTPASKPVMPDFSKMSKAEEQAWWARYKSGLGKK